MTEDKRTAKATAALMRKAEERRADWLRERGWTCTPPEHYPLPEGAGRVTCVRCGASAAADGLGSPIILTHRPGCDAD